MVIAVYREAQSTKVTEAVTGAAALLGTDRAGRLTATAAGSRAVWPEEVTSLAFWIPNTTVHRIKQTIQWLQNCRGCWKPWMIILVYSAMPLKVEWVIHQGPTTIYWHINWQTIASSLLDARCWHFWWTPRLPSTHRHILVQLTGCPGDTRTHIRELVCVM